MVDLERSRAEDRYRHGSTAALLDDAHAPLFWPPQRCQYISAWAMHIPFAHWLMPACAPRMFVELGTHTGASYAAFCQGVAKAKLDTRCYAVDTWRGDEHAGFYGDEIYHDLRAFNAARYAAFSELIRSTFDDALPFFAEGSIDLLHIDGFHTYEAARHDLESWRCKLSSRAVVLFHDTNVKESTFGVWKVFLEEADRHPSFEFLHGHGLGLVAIGPDVPAAVLELCELSTADVATVRERFTLLGARCEAAFVLERTRRELHELAVEPARLRHTIDQHEAVIAQKEASIQKMEERAKLLESRIGSMNHEGVRKQEKLRLLEARLRSTDLHEKQWSRRLPLGAQLLFLRISHRIGFFRETHRLLAEDIRATGLFDEVFYRAENPYVDEIGMDPALHFALVGWKMDRKPNLYFLPTYYLAQLEDADKLKVNPLLHYAHEGWKSGLRPGPYFDGKYYLDTNTDVASAELNPLRHFLEDGSREGRRGIGSDDAGPEVAQLVSIQGAVEMHNGDWRPLPTYDDMNAEPTLTIITDSMDSNHLFGGVGTAIVAGALAAGRLKARLRVVTRLNAVDPAVIGEVLRAHRISWSGPADFVHLPVGTNKPLSIGRQELVLTTSWWTTAAVAGGVPYEKILYLLQEDERMFFAHGDMYLRCCETLSNPRLRMLINTQMLFDHLADGPNALEGLRDRAESFEPAFPAFPRPLKIPVRTKKNFFFYARPRNDRNLYWRGLEVISACLQRGVLKPEDWNFFFVGGDVPAMLLHADVQPIVRRGMTWSDYAELVGTMDLGLCLMATPHPSYPPLDLAASGAVVVTNSFGSKISLDSWSSNILMASATVEGLCQALEQGVVLAQDTDQRLQRCAADNIPREWQDSMHAAFDRLQIGAR